jgi:UDP-N-acetylmuramyl pentapeptide phosphotransferase/UDP-N-acetylglucosamine-1-phosphate transferase
LLLVFVGLVGLTHAFNLIDGYNGLAGIVAILIGLSYAYVSFKLGDREMLIVSICLIAATAGFLILNYPRGLIFAGDGGAYFWGFTLALIGIMLVQRHSEVSPWYPLLLLIYPIWETLFSAYRKIVRGQSPGMADALHLHQLVYHRLVRSVFYDDEAKMLLSRNNRTTPYLIVFTTFAIIPATLFWNNTILLTISTLVFAALYCLAYIMIIRFKVPRWLQK